VITEGFRRRRRKPSVIMLRAPGWPGRAASAVTTLPAGPAAPGWQAGTGRPQRQRRQAAYGGAMADGAYSTVTGRWSEARLVSSVSSTAWARSAP